jgi:hypothetical protein
VSRTKPVGLDGVELWVYDASLSLLLAELAHMVEELAPAQRPDWWQLVEHDVRVQAIVSELEFDLGIGLTQEQRDEFATLLALAADQVERRGVFTPEEAAGWYLLEQNMVLFRGSEPINTDTVAELGRALAALLRGGLPGAPPGEWWLYGAPGGRRSIAMRNAT